MNCGAVEHDDIVLERGHDIIVPHERQKENVMRLKLLLGLCTLFFLPVISSAADWSHWRGPWQTGVSPETNLPDRWSPNGQNLIWKADFGCRSTPIVMNG